MNDDQCPVGCGRQVPRGKLLCAPCWGELPSHLRRDVYRTWRAWSNDIGNVEKARAYGVAKRAAIGAIR